MYLRLKSTFSFFNTNASETDRVLETFKDFTYKGRNIDVEVTTDTGGGKRKGGGKKGKRFPEGRKSSGGGRNEKSGRKGGRGRNIESSLKRRRTKK